MLFIENRERARECEFYRRNNYLSFTRTHRAPYPNGLDLNPRQDLSPFGTHKRNPTILIVPPGNEACASVVFSLYQGVPTRVPNWCLNLDDGIELVSNTKSIMKYTS